MVQFSCRHCDTNFWLKSSFNRPPVCPWCAAQGSLKIEPSDLYPGQREGEVDSAYCERVWLQVFTGALTGAATASIATYDRQGVERDHDKVATILVDRADAIARWALARITDTEQT